MQKVVFGLICLILVVCSINGQAVKSGFYKHLKGDIYYVRGVARDMENTSREFVVYESVVNLEEKDVEQLWIKPVKDFILQVSLDDGTLKPLYEFKGETLTGSSLTLPDGPLKEEVADDYLEEGYEALEDGDVIKAEENFKKAANLGNEYGYHELIDLYIEQKRYDEAEFYLLADAKVGHIDAYFQLGRLHQEQSNNEKAMIYLQIGADKGNPSAQNLIGFRYELEGDIENAKRYYTMAAKQEDEEALKDLIKILKKQGNVKEAEDSLREHVQHGDVLAHHLLAEILESTGRFSEAIEHAKYAADKNYKPARKLFAKLRGYKDEL